MITWQATKRKTGIYLSHAAINIKGFREGSKLKKLFTFVLAVILVLSMNTAVFASAVKPVVKGSWVPVGDGNTLGYLMKDGNYLQDGFTEDGYYVGRYGLWTPAVNILGAAVPMRNSWLRQSAAGEFEGFTPILRAAHKKLTQDLHGYRVISAYSSHIVLNAVSADANGKRTKEKRLAIYQNIDFNGYTIEVRTPLSGDEKELTDDAGEWRTMALYDYQVLRLFTNLISRCGDLVAKSIYESWEDANSFGLKMNEWVQIGDTFVRYIPAQRAGLYEIKAAF